MEPEAMTESKEDIVTVKQVSAELCCNKNRIPLFIYAIDAPSIILEEWPNVVNEDEWIRLGEWFNDGKLDIPFDRYSQYDTKLNARNIEDRKSSAWFNVGVEYAEFILTNDPKKYANMYKSIWIARDNEEADQRAIAIIDRRKMSEEKYLNILNNVIERISTLTRRDVKNLTNSIREEQL